ncbi:BEACH domain-containing protein [Phytophthora cinnamomi]|uniref:BEACH domain-containing protein n=1 Tax=Phytophthora cinnamomi TaxID=4785 RepID=UPI00355980C5|nr:BEACH domain-containing protein [Phytophthora cinnamomi]
MKHIFKRRVRSPSASSPSESPTHAHAQTSLSSPRRPASASVKGSAGANGPGLTEKRAVGGDALHAQVEVFATSTQAPEQKQALSYLYEALVIDLDPSQSAETLLDARDVNTLVSVGGQRLRSCLSRALELFNASRLDGNANVTFLLATDSDEREHALQLLQLLRVVLVTGDNAQALLLVSARIPSTLVKVVKALSGGGEADDVDELVLVILDVLAVLVTSPEVVQELNESSTLHRIFHLAFQQETLQMAVVTVVKALVQGLPQSRWRSMVKLLYEERCLLNLIHNANVTGVLAKSLSVTALALTRATATGLPDLHRQMNADRQRQKILTTFTQLFESQQRIICAGDGAPSNVETLSQHDEEFADAVADLCLSGNENPLQRGNIFQNKAFTLVIGSMENVTGQSYVNAEAFGLLSDILAYLHGPTKPEEERRGDGKARYEMICHRERLECYYLQKLGQIIVACRLDYEFLSNTRLLAHAVEKLDGYSEMAQHTIMSVLSAIAIESRIIPYVELVSMNAFIRQDTFQEHSIHALLAFIANLLRFDECYHEVLRSVGLVEAARRFCSFISYNASTIKCLPAYFNVFRQCSSPGIE